MPLTPTPITQHPATAADQQAMAAMRLASASLKGVITGPAGRLPYAENMGRKPAAADVTYAAVTVGGIAGLWCRPVRAHSDTSVLLFLHGGAYVLGSPTSHQALVSQLVARVGVACFIPDYRLGPEHPFPAAVEDAQAAYKGLVALGYKQVALAGDSAGGGLALVVLAWATRQAAAPEALLAPRAVLVFSPWTDLALASPSMHTRAEADPIFTREALASLAHHYLQGHDPHDPQASPVYGQLTGLAPVQAHVGDAEILLDDAVRYVTQAQAAGVVAELHSWAEMPHVFVSSPDQFEAARQALDLGAAFLTRHLQESF